MNAFDQHVCSVLGEPLKPLSLRTIQVNITLKCNLECAHCHVASSPKRREMMAWETMAKVVSLADRVRPEKVDITGGAPEIHPHFCRFVEALRGSGHKVMVRTNLTILLEPGFERMPAFFREWQVHLVASLPCYLEENVDAQRGEGAYRKSVEAIRRLNKLGYGIEPDLPLDLVYNPGGPKLPPPQARLEEDYRRELKARFGISFTRLFALANMPIGMFRHQLRREGKERSYMILLRESFNPRTLEGLMCRHQINIGWDGRVYDCDFNLACRLPARNGRPFRLDDLDLDSYMAREIATADHCFGCTAGSGSSCGGALA